MFRNIIVCHVEKGWQPHQSVAPMFSFNFGIYNTKGIIRKSSKGYNNVDQISRTASIIFRGRILCENISNISWTKTCKINTMMQLQICTPINNNYCGS